MKKWSYSIIIFLLVSLMFSGCNQKKDDVSTAVPERHEIAEEYTWNLEDLYPTVEAWEKEFEAVKEEMPELKKYEGTLKKSGKTILECLTHRDALTQRLDKLYVYAYLSLDSDTRNPEFQARANRISSLDVQFREIASYIVPELLAIPKHTLDRYIQHTPGLEIYAHYFDDLNRNRPHVLSPEQEQLLAMTGNMAQTPQRVHEMLTVTDIRFPKVKNEEGKWVELSPGRYYQMLYSKDPEVRRGAFEGMYGTYEKIQNVNAAAFDGMLKTDIFYARARNFESTRHASLFDDNIPVEVYDNLIESVHNNLEPLRKYMNLRKNVLNLDELHLYDTSVPIVPEVENKILYDEARKLVLEALHPLGEEYLTLAKDGLYGRWIDVYETKGKTTGAYSWGTYDAPHPYILLNYNDTRDNMFTLAHELGHTIHSMLTHENQPYIYSDYSLFIAEVASTMNEALLLDHLLKTTDDPNIRLALMDQWADNIVGTLYTQVLFAEFEKTIHEKAEAGIPITAETLNNTYITILKSYYGDSLVLDDLYKLTWGRIDHFYRSFYVYIYATSISASTYLSGKILEGDEEAVANYLDMLRAGGSDYPIELLKKAGVDMSTPDAINYTLQKFGKIVDEMSQELSDKR
ncbi:MAG: oligoendopeptidase F [Candidatus Marinimicrobia bacterium]|nr:oligoendopeptidase F [Candidatus Neomarinimicrobiota bacterium]MDD5583380.1 oligoendopeptidase F [Candidatus Neomarinimicrobiota bacterium]